MPATIPASLSKNFFVTSAHPPKSWMVCIPALARLGGAAPTTRAVPWRPRLGENAPMHVSAKADYAVRAAIELAAAGPGPVKGDRIADAQQIPLKFLENILSDLRHAGYVQSQRGAEGGYWLAQPADQVTLADIIRAVDGPLANVRGARPELVEYTGSASHLVEVWIAVRVSLRSVLERVTLADLVAGTLPAGVRELTADADAWVSRR
jgi:Rrf2 family protein